MFTTPSTAFEFATSGRILFGRGKAREAGAIAKGFGTRVLLVTGASPEAVGRAAWLREDLQKREMVVTPFPVQGEPCVDRIREGVKMANAAQVEAVVSFGGGSVIDAGKAVAILAKHWGDVMDYLEVVGSGKPLIGSALPHVAIPTTAGTGAEVTRNAVLFSPGHRVKVSLRSLGMLPRVALVDPELTLGLPPPVTASTGLDALTQLLEPLVSVRATPMSDLIAREGLARVARSLRRVYERGDDLEAREDMALASLLGGMALANAGLGAVHGLAGALGGMFSISHGAVCAALLPYVAEMNLRAARARCPDGVALARYAEAARILTGNPAARAEDATGWLSRTTELLKVRPLSKLGVERVHFQDLIRNAQAASSMKGNPVALTAAELQEILERAM